LNDTSATNPPEDPLLTSYAQLAKSLIGDSAGICLFDRELCPRGQTPNLKISAVARWVKTLNWIDGLERSPQSTSLTRGEWLTAIPLEQTDRALLGVFCIQQNGKQPLTRPSQHAEDLQRALQPLLDCVHREMAGSLPVKSRIQTLTERTAELEWLFKVTGNLKGSTDEKLILQELLDSAARRLESALGVIYIPGRRLCIERAQAPGNAARMLEAWQRTKQNLLTWAQRHRQQGPHSTHQDSRRARGARLRQGHRRVGVLQSAFCAGVCQPAHFPGAASGTAGSQHRREPVRSDDRTLHPRRSGAGFRPIIGRRR
jgi:hypothetical protein